MTAKVRGDVMRARRRLAACLSDVNLAALPIVIDDAISDLDEVLAATQADKAAGR